MITLFLGSLTAMLVLFVLALVLAAMRYREVAVNVALGGVLCGLVSLGVWLMAAWWVAYG